MIWGFLQNQGGGALMQRLCYTPHPLFPSGKRTNSCGHRALLRIGDVFTGNLPKNRRMRANL